MQEIVQFRNGVVVNHRAAEKLQNIRDGDYIMELVTLHPKTSSQYRELFFYRLKKVVEHTGDTPDEFYKHFKAKMDVTTLSGEITPEYWLEVNNKFKEYVFENLEIILK